MSGLTEEQITREVILLIAELHPLKVENGRIVIPDEATPELRERILRFEGELLWARGFPSGPRWGCSWVPASAWDGVAWGRRIVDRPGPREGASSDNTLRNAIADGEGHGPSGRGLSAEKEDGMKRGLAAKHRAKARVLLGDETERRS